MTERHILVVAHTGRDESLEAAVTVCRLLGDAGLTPVVAADSVDDLREATGGAELRVLADAGSDSAGSASAGAAAAGASAAGAVAVGDIELVIVLGGDGTILRAAELVRGGSAPLLGVNLGHVGFLAESERDDLAEAVARALSRDYLVEERMTLSVRVKVAGEVIWQTWALNEATVEKASRERMLDLAVAVDGRPLTSFGADGVVMATPTGSTAYAFSAGGPVVWPSLDALLMVPLSAHALFARPLVVGPNSSLAVDVLDRTGATGVLWCDGRRAFDLPAGARVVARRSSTPVRLARLHPGPFTDRLVHKFALPVNGWRGGADAESPATGVITVPRASEGAEGDAS